MLCVLVCDRAAAFGPLANGRDLDGQESRLEFVEARIQTDVVVMVFDGRAIIGPAPDAVDDLTVARDDGAAVAEGAEVLARIEAEACGVGQAADSATAQRRAMGLGGILDDRHAP